MTKAMIATILAATLTGAGAVAANQILDELAPKTSVAVLDTNLKTLYTAASTASLLDRADFDTTLAVKMAELQATDDSIQYRIEGDSLVASNDFACRRLVIGTSFVHTTDC